MASKKYCVVKSIDEDKGKGIIACNCSCEHEQSRVCSCTNQPHTNPSTATVIFHCGEVIFVDVPLVVLQNSENARTILACAACMGYVESMEQQWNRLITTLKLGENIELQKVKHDILALQTSRRNSEVVSSVNEPATTIINYGNNEPELPYNVPKSDVNSVEELKNEVVISCSYCQEVYCSVQCQTHAERNYHSILCSGRNQKMKDYNSFVQSHGTDRFLLISRIIAILLVQCNLLRTNDSTVDVDTITQAVYEKYIAHFTTGPQGRILNVNHRHYLKQALLLFRSALPTCVQTFPYFFTLQFWYDLLCRLDVNCQTVRVYSPWFTWSTKNPNVDLCEFIPFKTLNCEGVGLFRTESSLNHSCEPNCEVVVHDRETRAVARIVSKKNITHGDELCITYIDKTLPFQRRQEILKQWYFFDCDCTLCKLEEEKNKK